MSEEVCGECFCPVEDADVIEIFREHGRVVKTLNTTETLVKCSRCDIRLCPFHLVRAAKNGKKYTGTQIAMCDSCCWNHVG